MELGGQRHRKVDRPRTAFPAATFSQESTVPLRKQRRSAMQQAMEFLLSFGQLAILVIVVGVVILLLISFVDRYPRPKSPRDDEDHGK